MHFKGLWVSLNINNPSLMYTDHEVGERIRRGQSKSEDGIESKIKVKQWQSEEEKDIEKKQKGHWRKTNK